jgi:putative PIN family toxin of toxin-antitoxin system
MLLQAWRDGLFELVICEAILEELSRTFAQEYFQRHLSPGVIAAIIELLQQEATLVVPTTLVQGVGSHPEDDVILALAVSAQASYLVTGDQMLQRLRHYADVSIVSPAEFVAHLVESAGDGE